MVKVHLYISQVGSPFPSFWNSDVLILVYPQYKISMTLLTYHKIDDTFRAKQNWTVLQCCSTELTALLCCLAEHWHSLVTGVKTSTYMSLKIDLHKRNLKKKIIYNKLVFKNTKITSVTSVMLTTWHIYACMKSSNSVIWTAVL